MTDHQSQFSTFTDRLLIIHVVMAFEIEMRRQILPTYKFEMN